tara:strand:- start:1127 stop:1333 length:207 start_codon:yes stop_codon:yes gene_type:complete
MATFINSQVDDNDDLSIDELFDDLHMHINEAQNFTSLDDKEFCLSSAQGMLDYISQRLCNESKELEIV